MYLLTFSKLIDTDFDTSYEYIKEKLESPRAAEKLFDELVTKLDYIRETPFTRPLVQDRHLASLGIRSLNNHRLKAVGFLAAESRFEAKAS
jgi:plasmid stabilization system protein ParE